MRKVKSISLMISVLMIASLATVTLSTLPLAGATATDINPKGETVQIGTTVAYTVHSNTTSGTATVRLIVDKDSSGYYESDTDVLEVGTGSGAPGGVDIDIGVDTTGYAAGTYTVYTAEKAAPDEGADLSLWGEQTTTLTTEDTVAPVFVSAITGDSADGNSSAKNKIYLQFTEIGTGLNSTTVSVDDFTVGGSAPSGIDTVGDNYIILTLDSDLDTDATPDVVLVTGESISDKATPANDLSGVITKAASDGLKPEMDSAETKTTTTIEVTFSEDLDGDTVAKENFTVAGNVVTGATGSAGVVTLTLETTIALDATPEVTYTKGVLTDMNNNLAETTALDSDDEIKPFLKYVTWTDVDGSGEINGGDTLEFTFSEPMDTTTITAGGIDADLLVSGPKIYGSALPLLTWTADDKVLNVTLAFGETIEEGDAVNPADTVKDVAGNIDATGVDKLIYATEGPITLNEVKYHKISNAITDAIEGDTIEVGTAYDSTKEDFPIEVDVSNLTITSTGTAAETVIDAGGISIPHDGIIHVYSSNVTIDGFTIENCENVLGDSWTPGIWTDSSGTTLNDLIIRNVPIGIHTSTSASNLTVENSEIRDITVYYGIHLQQENAVIRNNDIENVVHPDPVSGFGCGCGIQMKPGSSGTRVIENNTFRNVDTAIAYGASDNTSLTIENNNFLSCNEAAIQNESANDNINAEYNYWGDDSGPAQADTAVGTVAEGAGNAIREETGGDGGNIDYNPWLTQANGTHYDFTYVLEEGLNLVSLPLIPDDNLIGTVLGSTANVNSVWSWNNEIKDWDSYTPGNGGDLTAMVDGEGYWIRIEGTADNKTVLAFNGHEYVSGAEVPSAYDVYVGWNLIGYKRTISVDRIIYLGSVVDGITERCYEAPRGTYDIVIGNTQLTPGYGYWLAVTADGTIYP